MNKPIIPIFFAIDNDYAKFFSVALSSLVDNVSDDNFYNIHILYEGLSEDNKQALMAFEKENVKLIFSEMNKNLAVIKDKAGTRLKCERFTLTIFFRLFIPVMFPQYDKAVYLDSDITILDDIAKFYNIDLGNNYLGGVVDKSVWGFKPIMDYYINASGIDPHEYINSGVLLMNLKELRKAKLDERFLYLHEKYEFDSCCPDQDYLNVLCKGKITFIDDVWNTMPAKDQKEGEMPSLIHYNLYEKPWHYKDVNYGSFFWDYAKKTSFYPELKNVLDNFTLEDKKKDEESLNSLLLLANTISNSKGTFKEIFESGKEQRL